MKLFGRANEIQAIDGLLDAARAYSGGALVLRGEAGVGLTALLDYAVDSARDMQALRVAGIGGEIDVPYGGLHRLLVSEFTHRAIPDEERLALEEAFGFERLPSTAMPFGAANVLLVSLAVLKVLAGAVEEQPVLCAVDDVGLLDEESAATLALISRRLQGNRVAIVLARHEPSEADDFYADLDDILVSPLPDAHARALIDFAFGPGLDVGVRERILVETAGNPLAIRELPTGSDTEPRSAFAGPLPLAGRLKEHFARRLDDLPPAARELVLLAASLNDGSTTLFWSAAERLGLGPPAGGAAEDAGLLRIGRRVRLGNGLVRSAAYELASPGDRRRVHRAIAGAAESARDPACAAWHRAAASPGPDEAIAAALVAAASQGAALADHALAAVLLERACSLTPEPAVQAERLLHAAEKALIAGCPERAASLVGDASILPLSELDRARVTKLRVQIALSLGEGGDGSMLVRAALEIAAHDERLARTAFLEAFEATIHLARLGNGAAVMDAAQAALAFSPDETDVAPELLLRGLALLFASGHEAAAPVLRRAIQALQTGTDLRWLPLAGLAALELWDDQGLEALVSLEPDLGERSRLTPTELSFFYLAGVDHLIAGRFARAVERFEDRRLTDAAHDPRVAGIAAKGLAMVSAWRGRPDDARIERLARDAVMHELGRHYALTRYAAAVLENGLGHYEAALIAAREAVEDHGLYIATFALPELIEASVRSGEPEIASAALAQLAARTIPSSTNWALGMLARSRALLAEGEEAELLYREAIQHLVECRAVPQLARAHLLYGEWLRRERRRRDAREQLRHAEGMFVAMGAEAFTARTQGELRVTEDDTKSRRRARILGLTAQETRIAGLAAAGSSNPKIGAELFISPRTVEYHLRNVYRKLGVSSRVDLARRLIDKGK
ncbi:MAG: LuxR C-terminal-related transcriptional regulator [Gaiellaceae bacterium]